MNSSLISINREIIPVERFPQDRKIQFVKNLLTPTDYLCLIKEVVDTIQQLIKQYDYTIEKVTEKLFIIINETHKKNNFFNRRTKSFLEKSLKTLLYERGKIYRFFRFVKRTLTSSIVFKTNPSLWSEFKNNPRDDTQNFSLWISQTKSGLIWKNLTEVLKMKKYNFRFDFEDIISQYVSEREYQTKKFDLRRSYDYITNIKQVEEALVRNKIPTKYIQTAIRKSNDPYIVFNLIRKSWKELKHKFDKMVGFEKCTAYDHLFSYSNVYFKPEMRIDEILDSNRHKNIKLFFEDTLISEKIISLIENFLFSNTVSAEDGQLLSTFSGILKWYFSQVKEKDTRTYDEKMHEYCLSLFDMASKVENPEDMLVKKIDFGERI